MPKRLSIIIFNPNQVRKQQKPFTFIARLEFDEMVKILRSKEIDVLVIEDSVLPVKPDAVFPNNWFCTLRSGELCVFPMFAMSHRIEKRDDIIKQLVADYRVNDF